MPVKYRDEHFNDCFIALNQKGIAVLSLAKPACKLEGLCSYWWPKRFRVIFGWAACWQGINNLSFGIEPDNLCNIRRIFQHMFSA